MAEQGGLAKVSRSDAGPESQITLSEVDKRRTELWTISVFVVAATAIAIALYAVGGERLPEALRFDLSAWVAIVLLVGLAFAFLIYVFEKERDLRRLTALLVEERANVAELEELDRLKSDFVATISHELKTPLTAIIGAAKTVARKGPSMKPEQHADFMDMIDRQGNRLLRLIEDVLVAARIESGARVFKRERLNLHELGETVIQDVVLSHPGRERDVDLRCEPPGPLCWADLTAVTQMISNLIDNALKYSEPGSKVLVVMERAPGEVTIEVADHGRGIAREQLATIFERFRQADASAKRLVGGVGLGLFIVKNLVEGHGGTVDVDSEPGAGTTFTIHLPQREESRGDDEEPSSSSA